MSAPKVLKFVSSVHEQREFSRRIVPIKGGWLEIGKFTPVIETFDIKERWEATELLERNDRLVVKFKRIDFQKMNKESAEIADKIIEKHGDLLAASLFKALANGAFRQPDGIFERMYKSIDEKLENGSITKIEEDGNEVNTPEYAIQLNKFLLQVTEDDILREKKKLLKLELERKHLQEEIENEKRNSQRNNAEFLGREGIHQGPDKIEAEGVPYKA